MAKTITLNETQLNLLREYVNASNDRILKHEVLSDCAEKDGSVQQHMIDYNAACKAYTYALEIEDSAARVFASSVAAELTK